MREKEIEIQGSSIYYVIKEDGAHITRSGRLNGEIIVPQAVPGEAEFGKAAEDADEAAAERDETASQVAVVAIEKKAFLSQKKLRRIQLPASIHTIGEWAFAYCSNLESVRLPRREIAFGKGVFLDCRRLEKIELNEIELNKESAGSSTIHDQAAEDELAHLLAASATLLDADYLMNVLESGTLHWLEKWDARAKELLSRADTEGYTKMVLCGEEDLELDMDSYRKEKRREKVRLCFRRLMNPYGLSQNLRQEMTDYILSHKKGCESEESWEVILNEHGDERAYFEFFCGLGGMDAQNKNGMLLDMGENHAEMKAFLLKYGQESGSEDDFFAGLTL